MSKVGSTTTNNNINSKISLSKQNSQIKNNSRIGIYNKNLENVDYLLKVADKNKRQLQQSYGIQVDKVDKKIQKNEETLSQILQEINEKETHIFEVQRIKVEGFKNEVSKFDKIRELMEKQLQTLEQTIKESKQNEIKLINQSEMIYEDYLSNTQEEILVKENLVELKETLKQIEKTYPKDFEFLCEDILLEKELHQVEELRNDIQSQIKELEKQKIKLNLQKTDKEERLELIEVEFRKIDEQIEESYRDNHLKVMEEYLINNISDYLVFSNLKQILQGKF